MMAAARALSTDGGGAMPTASAGVSLWTSSGDRTSQPTSRAARARAPRPSTESALTGLARQARAGDPAGLEALMSRVRQIAVRYSRARLGSFGAHDLAQDAAQEVCVAVLTALPSYVDRDVPFEAFVYSIAAHKVHDLQRTLFRHGDPVAEPPDRVDEAPTPEERALADDTVARAMELMADLPGHQREILVLRVAVGMSSEETAAALGMSPGAVRVAQHRALTALRDRMDELAQGGAA